MIFENEKKLLKIIKFTPPLFILIISIIMLLIQYNENNNKFKNEKEKIKYEYTQKNRKIIKERVQEVYNYIKREQEHTEEELKKSLKVAIDNAYAIANTIHQTNKDKDINEVKKLVTAALRNIRFNNGRGYFFVYEKKGKNVLLPHNPELEGKNFWRHQDAKGAYIIQDMTKLLSNAKETFYEWYWFNPTNPDKQRRKIGLITKFEPFDWLIGTGEYMEDFEKELQKKLLKNIKEIRFGNNGYIFVIDYNLIYLSHIRENYIGKHAIINNDTVNTKLVINKLIELAKKGEGFYSYIQNEKPGSDLSIKKTSFVKGEEHWKWLIGTGFYEDDIQKAIKIKKEELNKEFKSYLDKTLKVSITLTLILFLLSIYFSKLLSRKFTKYKKEIKQHMLNNEKQHNLMAQQSKMAAMGEMIGNIAHQWRQPLSTISTTATGIKLQKEMNILDDDFLIDGLDGINNSAQYLSNTIDDFRNFFKIDKMEKQINLRKVLEKAISLIYTQLNTKEIHIKINAEDIEIKSYENELIQVIINVLNNAKDELLRKDDNYKKAIFLNIYKEKEEAVIQIKDNAGGIPTDIIERVFEPYFTTKHKSKGTGIGLYMSREIIVKNMHGVLEVSNVKYTYEDVDYQGALFEIRLPLNS